MKDIDIDETAQISFENTYLWVRTAGMNEHIAKPLDLKVLAKVLEKWLLK